MFVKIVLTALLIQTVVSVDSKNICKMKDTVKCNGKQTVTCGKNHCATDQESCSFFLNLSKITLLRVLLQPGLFHVELGNYNTFMSKIETCLHDPYTWSASDVCINGAECFTTQIYPFGRDFVRLAKRIDCTCEDEYSFTCGKEFCAMHRYGCEGLLVKNSTVNAIKQCDHKNKKKIFRKLF